MTLYRIADINSMGAVMDSRTGEPSYPLGAEMLHHMVESGTLVPVTPCEHGNYARHIVGYGERMNTFAMCDGVGEEPETRTADGYYQ